MSWSQYFYICFSISSKRLYCSYSHYCELYNSRKINIWCYKDSTPDIHLSDKHREFNFFILQKRMIISSFFLFNYENNLYYRKIIAYQKRSNIDLQIVLYIGIPWVILPKMINRCNNSQKYTQTIFIDIQIFE